MTLTFLNSTLPVNPEQPKNAPSSIFIRLSEKVNVWSNPEHPANAYFSIFVVDAPIDNEPLNPEQSLNE